MEIEVNQPVKVKLKSILVHAKVCDSGIYTLKDSNNNQLKEKDGYVPDFFPGQHYGDYLELEIELETGLILNWKKPTIDQMQKFIDGDED